METVSEVAPNAEYEGHYEAIRRHLVWALQEARGLGNIESICHDVSMAISILDQSPLAPNASSEAGDADIPG